MIGHHIWLHPNDPTYWWSQITLTSEITIQSNDKKSILKVGYPRSHEQDDKILGQSCLSFQWLSIGQIPMPKHERIQEDTIQERASMRDLNS